MKAKMSVRISSPDYPSLPGERCIPATQALVPVK
jgi:hypothetical protein